MKKKKSDKNPEKTMQVEKQKAKTFREHKTHSFQEAPEKVLNKEKALVEVTQKGDVKEVQRLIEQHVDINKFDEKGETPLIWQASVNTKKL